MNETNFSFDNIYWLIYMNNYYFTMTKEVRHSQTFSFFFVNPLQRIYIYFPLIFKENEMGEKHPGEIH